jgi:1,4-dihydroxy-2-naphthoate octaprenyltransferase
MEAVAVLTNEINDERTDTLNHNSSPFTGGARVLVQGILSTEQLQRGRKLAAACLACILLLLALVPGVHAPGVITLVLVGLVLGVGYTAPPLKLAYRTWGELDVEVTHSILVFLLGHVSQGGMMDRPRPWLIALPMFFAILPAIILAGFPDLEADAAVGKQTLVARCGSRAAAGMATAATLIAVGLHAVLFGSPWWFFLALLIHAGTLMIAVATTFLQPRPGRMNGMLALALSYMLWFVWVPWFHHP